MEKRIGFVGLGTMGEPMAGHLLGAGRDLLVWNRTASKTKALRGRGAHVAKSLAELAQSCDAVILCVNRTEDVEECLAGLTPTSKSGTLFIDHSTISPSATMEIGKMLSALDVRFVDAPITGGSMGAQKGELTIFLGGTEADCAETMRIINPYSKRAERVGSQGAGQMAKMANQIAVAGAVLGLCECLSFAGKSGLDLKQIKELVGSGAAGSWAFENYGPRILARDWSPGFSVKNQRKDFAYCKEAAADLGASIPGTRLVDDLLAVLESEGRGEQATAALFEVLERGGL